MGQSTPPGADPGFRRGGFVHSEGGVSCRNFRSGSKLLQGPGQINKQKKIADSRGGGGGGFQSPKKKPCIRACPPLFSLGLPWVVVDLVWDNG